jgi:hypothetical protein
MFPTCSVVTPCHPGAALRDLRHDPLGRNSSEASPQTDESGSGSIVMFMKLAASSVRRDSGEPSGVGRCAAV